ncbi:MAG: hypothetical protein KY397_00620 [Gemmatimonadetes bacterium]|nr:hypothetical protein [Gemmatimonadota bacterium]
MIHFLKPFTRAVLGLAILGLAACETTDVPVTPNPPDASPTVQVNGVRLVTVVPSQRGLFVANNAATAQRVNAQDGATISNKDASLEVVPGSIPDDVTITMKAENDGYVSFKFGPNGLQFDPAAVLTISADKANLDGIDPSQLAIAGAHDDVDDWQVVGGAYDAAANSVSVEIQHFSRYALCVR